MNTVFNWLISIVASSGIWYTGLQYHLDQQNRIFTKQRAINKAFQKEHVNDEGISVEKMYYMLVKSEAGSLWIPNELSSRDGLLGLASWFTECKDHLPSKNEQIWFHHHYGYKFEIVLNNIYVQDQLLANSRYDNIFQFGKMFFKTRPNNMDDDAQTKEASFFITNFKTLSQECRKKLKDQNEGFEIYTLKCPYTIKRQKSYQNISLY